MIEDVEAQADAWLAALRDLDTDKRGTATRHRLEGALLGVRTIVNLPAPRGTAD